MTQEAQNNEKENESMVCVDSYSDIIDGATGRPDEKCCELSAILKDFSWAIRVFDGNLVSSLLVQRKIKFLENSINTTDTENIKVSHFDSISVNISCHYYIARNYFRFTPTIYLHRKTNL